MSYTLNADYSLSAPAPRGAGLSDDANLQGCIDYLATTYGGGKLKLAQGTYLITGGLTIKKGVKLEGQGRQVTGIGTNADIVVLNFDTSCTDASGLEEMSVTGYPYQTATACTVVLAENIRPAFDHVTIWYGNYAMYTQAIDARFYDCWFCGCNGGVVSNGASAYIGCKFDTNGSFASMPGNAFWQGSGFDGTDSQENWLVECDFNGPFANAILVQARQSGPYGVTKFLQCNIGGPVNINTGYITTFSSCWFYNGSFTVNGGGYAGGAGGQVIVDGGVAMGFTLSVPAGCTLGANVNIV